MKSVNNLFLRAVSMVSIHLLYLAGGWGEVYAQHTLYLQNNTGFDYSVLVTPSGNKALGVNQWTVLNSTVQAWQTKTGIVEFDPDTVLSAGDTINFDAAIIYGSDTIHLMMRLVDTTSFYYSASGPGFSHSWNNDNLFHEGQSTVNTANVTVKYKIAPDIIDLDNDVLFAIHDNFIYTIDASDFNDSSVINVMAYNIKLMPLITGDFYERATLFPTGVSPYQDVVVYEEVFSDSARTNYLTPAMVAEGFNYYTTILNDTALPSISSYVNGGVIIYSKWPIEFEAEYKYANCSNNSSQDCLASKGIKYARINKMGELYHVFGTHMEAGGTAADVQIRKEHFGEMNSFIQSQNIPTNEAVIFTGDFNTSPQNGAEYSAIKDSTAPLIPDHVGYFESTFSYADTGHVIDHLWGTKQHLIPFEANNSIITFRSIDSLMWDIFDFSDHRTAIGRFAYPNVSTNNVDTIICQGDNLTLSVNSNTTLSYQWLQDNTPLSGETLPSYTISNASPTDAGVYTCTVTNDIILGNSSNVLTPWFYPNGTEVVSQSITYPIATITYQDTCSVSIEEKYQRDKLAIISPSLNNGSFIIEIKQLFKPVYLEIYNNIGQRILHKKIQNEITHFNSPDISKGFYTILIKTDNTSETHKMIVY